MAEPRDDVYARELASSFIAASNRLLAGVTVIALLCVAARTAGHSDLTLLGSTTLNLDWIVAGLPVITLVHWWLAGAIARELGEIRDAEISGGVTGASPLLERLPALGVYTRGVQPRRVVSSR
jgi:hypothetical protein